MEPPVKPDESDCCNSGCNPCILDVYEEQLKKYNERKTQEVLHSKFYKNCLIITGYSIFKVINIENHADDAVLITFEFVEFLKIAENENNNLQVMYNPGQYFMLKAGPKDEEFQRSYTPIPVNTTKELQFTVLIKLYKVGKMSQYIRRLKIDSKTIWRGPYGNFSVNYTFKHVLFIAQGVGIAPLYSIICDILRNENCNTFLKLYFCCKSCDSIYLRNEIHDLQSNWNFSYEIFLGNSKNLTQKYNETVHNFKLDNMLIKKYFIDKDENIQVLICGCENFMSCFKEIVIDCNVEDQNIILF